MAYIIADSVADVAHTTRLNGADIAHTKDLAAERITHRENERDDAVTAATGAATASADYHEEIAVLDLDKATQALNADPTNDDLIFRKAKAEAWKAWVQDLRQDYIDYVSDVASHNGEYAVDLAKATQTQSNANAKHRAWFAMQSVVLGGTLRTNLEIVTGKSYLEKAEHVNERDLSKALGDKKLAVAQVKADAAYELQLRRILQSDSASQAQQRLEAAEAKRDAFAKAQF